jgi:dihydrodipicolinate reductase
MIRLLLDWRKNSMINIILRGCNGKMGQVITEMVEADDDTIS